MAPLMILNPKARKTRKASKKRRKPMTAKQLRYFGPRKASKKKSKAKAKKKRANVIIVESNPKGKTMAKKKRHNRKHKARKVFTHNPKKRRRSFRRNPRSETAGLIRNTLVPGAIGAGGAIVTDIALGYLPLPPAFTQGLTGFAVRVAAALAIGYAVGKVSNREAGEEAAAGGVIVAIYQGVKGYVQQALPNVPLNRYVPMNRYVPLRIAPPAMMNRPMQRPGLGYTNPARIARPQPKLSRANMRFISTR